MPDSSMLLRMTLEPRTQCRKSTFPPVAYTESLTCIGRIVAIGVVPSTITVPFVAPDLIAAIRIGNLLSGKLCLLGLPSHPWHGSTFCLPGEQVTQVSDKSCGG